MVPNHQPDNYHPNYIFFLVVTGTHLLSWLSSSCPFRRLFWALLCCSCDRKSFKRWPVVDGAINARLQRVLAQGNSFMGLGALKWLFTLWKTWVRMIASNSRTIYLTKIGIWPEKFWRFNQPKWAAGTSTGHSTGLEPIKRVTAQPKQCHYEQNSKGCCGGQTSGLQRSCQIPGKFS